MAKTFTIPAAPPDLSEQAKEIYMAHAGSGRCRTPAAVVLLIEGLRALDWAQAVRIRKDDDLAELAEALKIYKAAVAIWADVVKNLALDSNSQAGDFGFEPIFEAEHAEIH